MATFAEVQEAVRARYTLDSDAEHEFSITLEAQTDRAQRVMVRRYEAWGVDMLEFRSAFAEAGAFDPSSLLESNLQLPLGCVALHGKYLVLLHKASLFHLSVEGVLFLLEKMSVLADVLEERTGTDRF